MANYQIMILWLNQYINLTPITYEYHQMNINITYAIGIQPGVRVPPGVREDILGGT
jgi:hypothetical protein